MGRCEHQARLLEWERVSCTPLEHIGTLPAGFSMNILKFHALELMFGVVVGRPPSPLSVLLLRGESSPIIAPHGTWTSNPTPPYLSFTSSLVFTDTAATSLTLSPTNHTGRRRKQREAAKGKSTMCYEVTCRGCGNATFGGCGRHVAAVRLRGHLFQEINLNIL